MKSAIVLGTSRNKGNTHALAETISNELGWDLFDLLAYDISPFDYQHANRNDDFLKLIAELIQYEHIALSTPVYWYAPSAQMKTFMDRFSDLLTIEKEMGRNLRGKLMSHIATGTDKEAPSCFNEAFERTASYLGMNHVGSIYQYCPNDIDLNGCEKAIKSYALQVEIAHNKLSK